MTQSSLVDIVQITTNSSPRGNNRIERITPHCVVGQCSAVAVANMKHFKPGGCASATYIIGKDGEVLLNVPEDRRPWTTGGDKKVNGRTGAQNDYKAITFECASDATTPYAFRPAVYEKLVAMCIDICKRYGRNKLIWFSTPQEAEAYKVKENEMILTWHRWYATKSCPGDWMYSRGQDLANRVNAALGGVTPTPQPTPTPTPTPTPSGRVTVTCSLPMIKKGSKGSAVKTWQTIVGTNADGDFGPATDAATRKFQKTHKDGSGRALDVDGIVGACTWQAGLNSLT